VPFIQQQLVADAVTANGRVVVPKAVLEIIINDQVLTMAVNAGGANYAVGDTFELGTGTTVALNGVNFTATGRVTAETAGAATAVQIISAGAYTADPTLTNGATTTLTGIGSGLTIDVTMQTAQYTQDFSDYVDLLTNFEWLATSVKSTNAPTIGMRSELSASNDAVRLVVASGFDGGSTWLAQPGAPVTNLFYCNLPTQDPEIFVSVTERRVNVLVTDDGRNQKQYCGLGLFVPYVDVATNYPFPGLVHGQSTSVRAFTESFNTSNRGVVHPIDPGGSLGPYQYRDNLSTAWFGISSNNGNGADAAKAQVWPFTTTDTLWDFTHAPIPTGSGATAAEMNPFGSSKANGSLVEDNTQAWFDAADSTLASQGPAPLGIGGQMHFTVQAHIISNQTDDVQIVGFFDGWEAVHGRGLAAFEEIETAAGRRYLVFNDTDSTALGQWTAMEIA
jgi:hypothetical protein